jgi:hypothetical protein
LAPVPAAAAALGDHPAGQHPPILRARRQETARSRQRQPPRTRSPRPPGAPIEPEGSRHRESDGPRLHRPAEDAADGSDAVSARHERPSRRLPLERVHGLPRALRERSEPGAFGADREVRQSRLERFARSDDPEERAGPPDRAQADEGDPVLPVRRLPHAPRNERGEHVLRHDLVGQRDGRRALLREGSEAPLAERARRQGDGEPERGGAPRQVVRRRSPTSTATAGSSATSTSRTARATCSTSAERSSAGTIPSASRRPCT